MKRALAAAAATLLLCPWLAGRAVAQGPTFSDVPSTYWAYGAIEALAAQAIIQGQDGLFHPTADVTRGQLAAFLVRAEHLPMVKVGPRFKDVTNKSALYEDIETAAAAGLMSGTRRQQFSPASPVSRAVAASAVVQALGLGALETDLGSSLGGFSDLGPLPATLRGAAITAARLGVMQGVSPGKFGPSLVLNRAEAAEVIERMLALAPNAVTQASAPLLKSISAGSGTATVPVGGATALWAVPRDATGQVLPTTVEWSASAGGSVTGGAFSAQMPGSYKVTASVYGSSVTHVLTIHVVQPTSLAISGAPGVAGPGQAIALQVSVLDQSGKPDRVDGSRLVTFVATSAGVAAVSTTESAQGGLANFTFTPPAPGAWTLTATSAGLKGATVAFDVLAAAFRNPLQLTGPTEVLPGQTASYTAALPQGASESSPATLTSSDPGVLAVEGSGSAALGKAGRTFKVDALAPGTATLSLTNAAGAYAGAGVTVTVPALGALAVAGPSATAAGAAATADVSVHGAGVSAPAPTVSLSVVDPQGVTVATLKHVDKGSQAFSLQEDEAGTWQLKATAPGYSTATSTWVVRPGAPTKLIATGDPSTVLVAGQRTDLAVMLADRFDNPVSQPLSVELTAAGRAGSLSRTAASLTGPGAAATFSATAPGTEAVTVRDPAAPQLGTADVTFRVVAQASDVVAGKGFWLLASDLAKQPVPKLLARLRQLGATHVYLEVEGTWGFYGTAELNTFLYQAHDAGIAVLAWVYPYLNDVPLDEGLTSEVASYAAPTGDRPDGIAADIEENIAPGAVASYAAAVRQALGPGGVFVAVTYPPVGHQSYPFAALAPYVTAFAPMVYWHFKEVPEDFMTTYEYVLQSVSQVHKLAGLPDVPVSVVGQTYDMFSGTAQGIYSPTPLELQAAMQACTAAGAVGISFYRLPTATPAELGAIETLPYPDPNE